MSKQKEIIDAMSFLEKNNQRPTLSGIRKILLEKNIIVSDVYLNNIFYNRKNIINKLKFYKDKENKILKIIQNNNDNNKIYLKKIKKIADKTKIYVGLNTIKKIAIENGYQLEYNSNFDDFSKRRTEMAELTRAGWTMTMIANKYGITKQAVSLLLKKAAIKDKQIVVKNKRGTNWPNCILVKKRKNLDETKVCQICGNKFVSKNNKKTCSDECYHKLMRKGGKWSRHSFVTLTCNYCGKTFERSNQLYEITMKKKKSNNHYCNRECYSKAIKIT